MSFSALAQAYQAVAAKLPEKDARASEALAPVLTAIQAKDLRPDQLSALAQAYQAVAAKLPEKDARASEALAPVLTAIQAKDLETDQPSALAQAYQAVAAKLPADTASEALAAVLTAIQAKDLRPAQLSALAQAYQAVAAKLPIAALRKNQELLEALRIQARSSQEFLEFSTAELMAAENSKEASELAMNLLSDPLSFEARDKILDKLTPIVGSKDAIAGPPSPTDIWSWVERMQQREQRPNPTASASGASH